MGNICGSYSSDDDISNLSYGGEASRDALQPSKIICENPQLALLSTASFKYGKAAILSTGLLSERKVSILKLNAYDITNELSVLRKIDHHKNIIQHFFVIYSEYAIMESIDSPLEALNLTTQYSHIVVQLADAVEFLQSSKIAHLNLSVSNIFIKRTKQQEIVKIGNFRFARFSTGEIFKLDRNILNNFSAPEISKKKGFMASDIYSLGAIIFWILTRSSDLRNLKFKTVQNIVSYRHGHISCTDILCADLIQKLTVYAPSNRLEAHLIKQHPFFWSPEKIMLFIMQISKLTEPREGAFRRYLKETPREKVKEILEGHYEWTNRIEEDILKILFDERNKFEESKGRGSSQQQDSRMGLISLIQTIRNISVHYLYSDILVQKMGSSQKLVDYWMMDKFPKLLVHLYNLYLHYQKQTEKTMISCS